MSDVREGRSVRLPFGFGDTVYHKARIERVPGYVVGFIVVPGQTKILVRWGTDLQQDEHFFGELTTEFTPSFDG
jgi:hypothetical protein